MRTKTVYVKEPARLDILTSLILDGGNVTSRITGATFHIHEADAHRDKDAGNDFEVHSVNATWEENAAQSNLIESMRLLTDMVKEWQREALQ
jgi:hypothetical protein